MTQRSIETPTSFCRFGVARGDITPPVGIYHRMWGAALHDRSEGIHRPLTATAMAFQPIGHGPNNASQQVVVAIDHCLLGRAEMDSLLDRIQAGTKVPRENLIVAFSHTHAAGLMLLDRVDLPGGDLIPGYLEKTADTVVTLVRTALQSMVPAVMTYGTGRCDLARHRDFWDEQSNQWVCGLNPDGNSDDTLLVARVTDASGQELATIVNYACHPTTLAWDNRQISPDYPGAMRETIEQVTGVPCVFLQGASGELGPKYGYVGDPKVADQNGRQLGYAALSVLSALPPAASTFVYAGPVVSGATLGVWKYQPMSDLQRTRMSEWRVSREVLPLRYRPGLPSLVEVEQARREWLKREESAVQRGDQQAQRDARAMVERQTRMTTRLKQLPAGDRFPYQLTIWRMGGGVWVAAQGESYSLLQTTLRERFPDIAIVVCSLANGWGPSYLPPAELYDRGLYQESIAALAPGSLEQIIAEAICRIQFLLETND